MRALVATIAVDVPYFELTEANMRGYAELHGADFYVQTRPEGWPAKKHPTWLKFEILKHFVESEAYDKLLYVDADVYMLWGSPSVFHYNYAFRQDPYVTWDMYSKWAGDQLPPIENKKYFNAGVFVIDKEHAQRLVQKAAEIPQRDSRFLDQNYFNLLVHLLEEPTQDLPREFNAMHNHHNFHDLGYFLHAAGAPSKIKTISAIREEPITIYHHEFLGDLQIFNSQWLRDIVREVADDDVYGVLSQGTVQNPQHVIDVGANIGVFSRYIAAIWPTCRIDAIEPYAPNAYVLRKNLQGYPYATVHEAIAWNDTEIHPFASWRALAKRDQKNVGAGTAGGGHYEIAKVAAEFQVPAIRVSDLITADHMVDLLKLDCEGGEFAVLEDLRSTNKLTRVRQISCEYHGRRAIPAIRRLLQDTHDLIYPSGTTEQGIILGTLK